MTKKRSPANVPGDLRGRAEKLLAAGENRPAADTSG